MNLTPHQESFLVIACGLYLVVTGLTGKTLISESDIPATEEERVKAKATPIGRMICVGLRLIAVGYGIFSMMH